MTYLLLSLLLVIRKELCPASCLEMAQYFKTKCLCWCVVLCALICFALFLRGCITVLIFRFLPLGVVKPACQAVSSDVQVACSGEALPTLLNKDVEQCLPVG